MKSVSEKTMVKAAILVDADNLPVSQAEEALKKLAEICNPVIKKAFGDFTKSAKNWTPEFLRKHGFTPEMHFAVSNFKNGADIAMCIAAMDIIHTKPVEAIVLFTSDSDFASLAARIREAGLEVVGVGDAKASEVLRGAFDTFLVIEAVKPAPKPAAKAVAKPTTKPAAPKAVAKPKPAPTKLKADKLNESAKALQNIVKKQQKKAGAPLPAKIPPEIRAEIRLAVEHLSFNGEPVLLAQVHARVKEKYPHFDFKNLKFSSLSKLLRTINQLELVENNRKVRLAK